MWCWLELAHLNHQCSATYLLNVCHVTTATQLYVQLVNDNRCLVSSARALDASTQRTVIRQ